MKQRRLSSVFTTNYSEGEFQQIEVQVLLRNGLPRFDIIGLPQTLIREGKDRILASLSRLGIELPSQKILVNLSPAAVPKQGSHFDLPILAAILKCLGILPGIEGKNEYYWGEVSLNGDVLPFPDFLPHYLFASRMNATDFKVHLPSSEEEDLASWLSQPVHVIKHIEQLFDTTNLMTRAQNMSVDFIDQKSLKLWLEDDRDFLWNQLQGSENQFLLWTLISLFRFHSLIEGPPGCGKSTWALAMKDLRSPLAASEWPRRIIGSQSPTRSIQDIRMRPFIAPHHSSSRTSIVGGGSEQISPGALSQAHLGTLFLDEIGEFARDVVESLREPLENKQVTIARGAAQKTLPANTQIIAAMNPCRCGRYGSKKNCLCSTSSFYAYRKRISEPLKNRFHLVGWWAFKSGARPDRFRIQNLKHDFLKIPQANKINHSNVQINPSDSPRRQRLWLEFFTAWCRWHHVLAPSVKDQTSFNSFLEDFKGDGNDSIL